MKNTKVLALLGCDTPSDIASSLCELGFEVVLLPIDSRLQEPVRSHADMLLCVIENNVFCSEEYFKSNKQIFERLEKLGYTVIPCEGNIGKKYPEDIAFNLICAKNSIIGKLSFSSPRILEYSQTKRMSLINVNQGYARCSTLLLGDSAMICADDGILKEARSLGFETLKAENSPESVTLPGYGYGFIGGASGVFEKNVYFCGDITKHPQGKEIAEFCEKFGFGIISLSDKKLYDVGGIIFLPPLE